MSGRCRSMQATISRPWRPRRDSPCARRTRHEGFRRPGQRGHLASDTGYRDNAGRAESFPARDSYADLSVSAPVRSCLHCVPCSTFRLPGCCFGSCFAHHNHQQLRAMFCVVSSASATMPTPTYAGGSDVHGPVNVLKKTPTVPKFDTPRFATNSYTAIGRRRYTALGT